MSVRETTPQCGGSAVSRRAFLSAAMLGAVGAARPRLTRGPLIAMMGSGEPKPYDAEVEYLESDNRPGYTYIDTGLTNGDIINNSFDIEMRTLHTTSTSGLDLHLTYHAVFFGAQNGMYYTATTRSTIPINEGPVTLRLVRAGTTGSGNGYINGTKNSTFAPNNSVDRILLFRSGTGTTTVNGSYSSRVYWCKITIDGLLVRDMIPVRVGDVGFFYDRASRQLFGNHGLGVFVVGPDK